MIASLNDWAGAWGPWFLTALVQNTLFLGLVFLALWLLRGAAARIKAAVATLGLLKLLVPPVLPLNWFMEQQTGPAASPVTTLLFPFAEAGPTQATAPGRLHQLFNGLEPLTLLMLIWASVALGRLVWAAVRTLDLALAVQGAVPVPAELLPRGMDRQGVRVLISTRISMPLTLGPWSRRIFVPPVWQSWPAAHRAAVLRHELAHIRRRDGLAQLAETVAQAVFFFHPLVALLIRRLRIWREMACDDFSVGRDPGARLAYSRFLVHLAESALGPRPATESASTLARRKCELLKRVTYQVREDAMKEVSKIRLGAILVVLLMAVVPLSVVLGQAPPPPPPPAKAKTAAEAAPVAKPAPVDKPAPKARTEQAKTERARTEQAKPAPARKAAPAGDDEKKQKEMLIKKKMAGKDTPPPPPKHAMVMTLTGQEPLLDGQAIHPEKMKKILAKAAQLEDKAPVIVIDSQGQVPMSEIHQWQKELRDLGLTRVKYKGPLGQSLAMALPPEKAVKKLDSLPEKQVMRVKVDGQGVVTMNGRKTKGAKVAGVVASALDQEPEMVFALHTDGDTHFGAFVQVLDGLKEGGATRIAILDPEN